jgi:hypothetical protein
MRYPFYKREHIQPKEVLIIPDHEPLKPGMKFTPLIPDNKYETACKEFLKGCSNIYADEQENCAECLHNFMERIKKLAKDEGYKDLNVHCIKRIDI